MIFVIDDDDIMAECVVRAVNRKEVQVFSSAIEAMNEIAGGNVPEMIFLDILLDGPDGFTFLQDLVSYADTAVIPVVIISSLDFSGKDMSAYGVVGVLNKDIMKPGDIRRYVEQYA